MRSLILDALRTLLLQPFLDRVADVCRDVPEVWHAGFVPAHAFAIVDDLEARLVPLAASDDVDVLGPGIDAVLDELRHGLQRVILRQRDDADLGPLVRDKIITTF